jgi:DNA-binding NarL/FixJ family response regulator
LITKCLLVCENDVLVAGVRLLLAEQNELEVYTIGANIEAELAQTLETLHPDTVILDEEVRSALSDQLWTLLMSRPDLQVIAFNQNNNTLHVHQNDRTAEAHVRNLGEVIRNHSSPSLPS